jgi:hypothetical protein
MENIIVGMGLGGLLMLWSVWAQLTDHLPEFSSTLEAFFLASVLTAVVAWIPFQMPTPFARHSPFWAQVTLGVLAGLISLFFDSFAVVLLLAKINTLPMHDGINGRHRFNEFAFRAVASFNALTVGGAFYLGELWGLPYYIASHMDTWWTGLPVLPFVVVYCVAVSLAAAWLFPVRIEAPLVQSPGRWLATFEMVSILLTIIVTHNTALAAGLLLVWSAVVRRDTHGLIQRTAHEVHDGGANALALILCAIVVQQLPGTGEWVANLTQSGTGWGTVALAAMSSPFAGAMLPAAESPEQFYTGLTNLMVGAPLFVWSSLVAIMVFKSHVAWEDIPMPDSWKHWRVSETVSEYLLYSFIAVPLAVGLGVVLEIAHLSGVIMYFYHLIGG